MKPDQWPERIRRLPRCTRTGLPVPFSSGVDEHGAGRFGVNDPMAKLACAMGRRCGICGDPFEPGEDLVFLVADRPLSRPVFPDPPSHEDCAEASLELCTHIANPRLSPVPAWQMWVTGSYEPVPGRVAMIDFLPGPATRVRRFTYGGGTLTEVTDAV